MFWAFNPSPSVYGLAGKFAKHNELALIAVDSIHSESGPLHLWEISWNSVEIAKRENVRNGLLLGGWPPSGAVKKLIILE
jgi:hypothetical protein